MSREQQVENKGFKMAGTEGSYEYVVLATTPKGRVGVRDLGNEEFRVRVEPTEASAAGLKKNFQSQFGWKQPGSQNRFSKVIRGQEKMEEVVLHVLKALGVEDGAVFQVNPDLPEWGVKLLTEATKPLPKQEPVPEQVAIPAPKPEPDPLAEVPVVAVFVARRRPVMRVTTTVVTTTTVVEYLL